VIEAAIEANSPVDLYDYLADPVHVAFAASDFDDDRTPDQAITDLEYIDGSTGWNWNLDSQRLDEFRDGDYGDRFTEDALVGESAEGYIISIDLAHDTITAIFVSKSADLVTEPAAPTSPSGAPSSPEPSATP
jgi:hypothetical protein